VLWQAQFVINPMRRKRRFDKPIFYGGANHIN
jgi:hypothetical protein